MGAWVYTGEKLSKRIRERYLTSVLRQDVAVRPLLDRSSLSNMRLTCPPLLSSARCARDQFFDTVGAGEVATRIQTDTHLIQEGTSEKVALAVSYISVRPSSSHRAPACSL